MEFKHTLLVADRNQHVRDFLRRELSREGYRIQLTRNARELLRLAFGRDPVHLLIIDPDLPGADDVDILKTLGDRLPALPLIIHGFISDYEEMPSLPEKAVVVEKGGKSIERLKAVIAEILQKTDTSPPGFHGDQGSPK